MMTRNIVFNRLIVLGSLCCGLFLSGCVIDNSNAELKSTNTVLEKTDTGFANHYWKLLKLNGKPVVLGSTQTEIHLITGNNDKQMHGFSGCNRFTGSYNLNGDRLEFGQVASTRMACVDDDNPEMAFLHALASVKRLALEAGKLMLFDDQNRMVLEFEAVYLR